MIAISLSFPAKRFHATPWGRQVNEGAVEWPPSPWRLLRSLVATWYHKFPDVPEQEMRQLVELLAVPPRFNLPNASQGHTRHYMPLVNDERTKVFDTFIAVEQDDPVQVIWNDVTITPAQSDLLDRLLKAMTYFGRAESWVCASVADDQLTSVNAEPVEMGIDPQADFELVRTLVPVPPEEHIAWFSQTKAIHRQRKLAELIAIAQSKGKSVDQLKLSKKDEQMIDDSLPPTLFDALHADTAQLRKAGWNQPPGTRWINYARPIDSFSPRKPQNQQTGRKSHLPTVARFAVCGRVRPLLTDSLIISEQVRHVVMGCSKAVREDENAAPVFSGKHRDGSPLSDGHQHAHFLCEATLGDARISHVTISAPMRFDTADERAMARLAKSGVWGVDGYELQLVLLGVGQAGDFGGFNEKAGQSKILATASVWESRTPFILTRHLTRKGVPSSEAIAEDPKLREKLIEIVRFELAQREQFKDIAKNVLIEPLLERGQMGTDLGGHFTSWLKFRRDRLNGGGSKAGDHGFGFRMTFPRPVTGPIALGYGCHFGLGCFAAVE